MEVNFSKVEQYPKLGNGLSATRNLSPGDVIIRVEEPLILVVENNSLSKICSHCFFDKEDLKRCSGCKVPYFCSTSCQKAAWKSGHREECAIYQSLPGMLPTETRALVNLLIRKELTSESRWNVLQVQMAALQKTERLEAIVLQAKAAVEFTKSPQSFMGQAICLMCIMSTNAFRAALPDSSPLGLCLEPKVAMANHSCTPNAFVSFDGRRMVLQASGEIKKGEQIFISYIDPDGERDVRRAELRERYLFDCYCQRCVMELEDGSDPS